MLLRVLDSVEELSRLAAAEAAAALTRAITSKGRARFIAATGSTQFPFLDALTTTPGIDWTRVELFHLDEYLGLPADHPGSFRRFIRDRIITPTGIVNYHLIDGDGEPAAVIRALTSELRRAPVDLAVTGIGENGHLAFNEPPADFNTGESFKVVTLDDISRRQQVGEAWFPNVEAVPTRAITMTVPEILRAGSIVCLAYGARKAHAVGACFNAPPSPGAPASVLATHAATTVYLDRDAAVELRPDVLARYGASASDS
jgi:glucosamine-6-phosphate deaminase